MFDRLDVLFNNAAVAYFNWLEDITDEEWDRDRREEVDLVFYLGAYPGALSKNSHASITPPTRLATKAGISQYRPPPAFSKKVSPAMATSPTVTAFGEPTSR